MIKIIKVLTSILFITLISLNSFSVLAEEKSLDYKATVINIKEEKITESFGIKQFHQLLEVRFDDKSKSNVIIDYGVTPSSYSRKIQVNDRLIIGVQKNNQLEQYFVKDYIRTTPLIILVSILLILVIVITRLQGVMAIIAMLVSFFMIFNSILPNIIGGSDPVVSVILACLIITPITFYLSHGLNRKTTISIMATMISLIITGVLAAIFVSMAKLTGFTSDEAGFLQVTQKGQINMSGILLAGIIIGALGVLDDITISQASIVDKIRQIDPSMNDNDVYKKAMAVGHDHIASMINTLILVYAGASLPLFLLFYNQPKSISEIINHELIAEEIVRTAVGSIGLICAVPITTWLSIKLSDRIKK